MKDETKKGCEATALTWRTYDGPRWVAFEPAELWQKAVWNENREARPPLDMPECDLVGYAITEAGVFEICLMEPGPSTLVYIGLAYGLDVSSEYMRAVYLELAARGVF